MEELTLEELARAGETYEPRQRAIAFARRFGAEHAKLALYAALPLGLTPDLVHLLRINFVPGAPWIAEADLLLSSLCREAGGDFYEMDERVRELLLDEFVTDENFGIVRLRRAAEFLYVYAGRAQRAARRRDTRAFWQAQEWTALAYARPEEAARMLASELGRKINEADASEALRVARVANTLASPLGAHDELVLYAAGFEQMLSGGDSVEAFELFDAAGSNDGALNVAGVSLPSTQELASRLGLQTPSAPVPAPQSQETQTQTQTHIAEKNPRGFTLTQTFTTGGGYVTRLAWSPDGKFLAAPSTDSTIYAWEAEVGGTHILQAREGVVREVAWSPDGKRLAAITDRELLTWDDVRLRSYEPDIRQHIGEPHGVSWLPNSDALIVADISEVFLHRPGISHFTHEFSESGVHSIVWLATTEPLTQTYAYLSEDGSIGIRELQGQNQRFEEHKAGFLSLTVAPDAVRLAAGGRDGVIKIWDGANGILTSTLEGHTGAVASLSFSADGRLLASKSVDGSVRLWKTETWETIAVLDEPANEATAGSGIAFHPQRPDTLATLDETGRGVRVWRLDLELLTGHERKQGEFYYRNANILLLGDVASGKTALAQRLVEFRELPVKSKDWPPATQGLSVSQLYIERVPRPDGGAEVREVTIFDPAGELMDRLSESVRLDDVSVALFVFDPSRGIPARDFARWNEELQRAQATQGASVKAKRFLVETHIDLRNEDSFTEADALAKALNFDNHLKTSVQTGRGVGELWSFIRGAIDWDARSGIVTAESFGIIKDIVDDFKQGGAWLVRVEDLMWSYRGTSDAALPESARAELEIALKVLEQLGTLRLLDFGGLVLLHPEVLDVAASDISSRVGEDGFLSEERI